MSHADIYCSEEPMSLETSEILNACPALPNTMDGVPSWASMLSPQSFILKFG